MQLASGHGWRAQPKHKILVLDRGTVQLEYPEHWVVEAGDDCVNVHDKPPPDDDCVLGVSYHIWPPEGGSLPVAALVQSAMQGDERSFTTIDPVVAETRIDIELAWAEARFIDPGLGREACTRLCIARKADIQALLTFDFWYADLATFDPRWHAVLASLRLGVEIDDPRRGPALH